MRTLFVASLVALLCGAARAGETLYFVHVDHLNTPRLAVGEDGVERWRWDQLEPFGENPPIEVMGPEGYLVNLPLRFPGQYADKETGLAHNMARDYDAGVGRYVQSDPIGLKGGLNTYAYVNSSPMRFADPTGLFKCQPMGLFIRCEWGSPPAFPPTGDSELDRALNSPATSSSSSSDSEDSESDVTPTPESCYQAYLQTIELVCKKLKTKNARRQCYENAMTVYSECLRQCKPKKPE